ncbi:MAG: phosphopantothenoylcysteine decarboxylase [Elusimicrobiota bacterium]
MPNTKLKKILISSGPTRVFIDPLRYITNISSGLMGRALAKQAKLMGFDVTVISGPVNIYYPKNIEIVNVSTNDEMYREIDKKFKNTDIFISAAAVVDFEPEAVSKKKIKRTSKGMVLRLHPSRDIVKSIAKKKRKNQIVVGFALETEDLLINAKKKLLEKKLNYVIANKDTDSLGKKDNKAVMIKEDGTVIKFYRMSKSLLAKKILLEII